MKSDNFEAPLTVISFTGNATVTPTPNSTQIYKDLRPQQRELKHIFKSNDGEPFGIGTLSITTTHDDIGLYFENYNYSP
ncbi:hypothetical protein KI688_002514 [Linnemannia hyalina]|uniref:Uncharacterized protein n=1 Tax=Linnemannia hyalina TaxID=64524 RepID=A0A9P7XT07_9FUNG|nr:hypothetical protein KI688_002514 [Linnemannia hyalina]